MCTLTGSISFALQFGLRSKVLKKAHSARANENAKMSVSTDKSLGTVFLYFSSVFHPKRPHLTGLNPWDFSG